MQLRSHLLSALAVAAGLVLGVTGCTGSARSPRPAHEVGGKAELYVALGGDDVAGDRRRFTDSWPQLLFRTNLPVSATFVNLAGPREGAEAIRGDQLPTALRLRPNLVSVTLLDDLERGTPPVTVRRDLAEILRRLGQVDGIRVLVGTAPPNTGSEEARLAFNAIVSGTVRAANARLVNLDGARATDPQIRAQQIADAFARAIRRS